MRGKGGRRELERDDRGDTSREEARSQAGCGDLAATVAAATLGAEGFGFVSRR